MKPEGSNVSYRDLAERFYALDTEVYNASGSELGKVFPGPKHISEKQILKDFEHDDTEKIKDETDPDRKYDQDHSGEWWTL